MKKTKIIYWTTTGVFTAMMTMSAVQYFINPDMAETFKHLGFSDSFRMELGIAKLIGGIVLLLPMLSSRVKEWAYAGFGITLISAFIAHLSAGDPIANAIIPLVMFGVLAVSNIYHYKLKSNNI
tara:strand:- start:978 stop:1349 length:372 start_codon:yes stop_codon:yes gene_type:complete